MQSPQVAPQPLGSSKWDIRWRAFVSAVVMVGFVVVCNLYFEKPWPIAVRAGIGAGFAGLATWITYHWVSRRNDGLLLISGVTTAFINKGSSHQFGVAVLMAFIGVFIGLIFGWLGRARRSDPDEASKGV